MGDAGAFKNDWICVGGHREVGIHKSRDELLLGGVPSQGGQKAQVLELHPGTVSFSDLHSSHEGAGDGIVAAQKISPMEQVQLDGPVLEFQDLQVGELDLVSLGLILLGGEVREDGDGIDRKVVEFVKAGEVAEHSRGEVLLMLSLSLGVDEKAGGLTTKGYPGHQVSDVTLAPSDVGSRLAPGGEVKRSFGLSWGPCAVGILSSQLLPG